MAKSKKEIQQFWAKRGVHHPDEPCVHGCRKRTTHSTDAQQQAQDQQRYLIQMMQNQQRELLTAATAPGPKASQSLRSRNYQPKFKTRGSKAETNRAVSKGTAQFTNPLSMGGGVGGSSINLG